MNSLANQLKEFFWGVLEEVYAEQKAAFSRDDLVVTQSTQEKFGHYQCNSAMRLAKPLRSNPRQIATALVEEAQRRLAEQETPWIERIEIAGPGFLNIWLSPAFLVREIEGALRDERLGIPLVSEPHRILIDYSGPNIAKEMHVGHLRSTILGDCLERMFRFLGHEVKGINHVGDWGTSFGMLIAYVKEEVLLPSLEEASAADLMRWYREAKQKFDAEADFKKQSQLEVVALQGGEAQSLAIWKSICDISRRAFNEVYRILNVSLEERGESFYNPFLAEVVDDLESRGFVKMSDGAKCIFLEGFQTREGTPLPMMIQKSDGGFNYSTTDMAALRHRVRDEKAKHLIYVTDAGQSIHFQMLFQAACQAGYYDPREVQVDHVSFGLVLREDGKKFRTRSGETERLVDLLHRAEEKAFEILQARGEIPSDIDQKALAHALGINAVKYADLSCHRTSDYVFSYERMLRFEGNTAAFIMYAYVRVAGIKRKIGLQDVLPLLGETQIELEHESEFRLALKIRQFDEALEQATRELLPHRLTDYLYGLAEAFHAFFRDCRVEGSAQEKSRLLLCEAAARAMSLGMQLLGLQPVERM